MSLPKLIAAALLAIGLAFPAAAQSFEDSVVRQLQRQGYDRISIGRTLLGRSRIVARNESGRREIVLNPRTGVILRDYLYPNDNNGGSEFPKLLGGGSSGGSAGNGSSGGGNSGPGSENSGSGGDDDDDDEEDRDDDRDDDDRDDDDRDDDRDDDDDRDEDEDDD